MTAIHTTSFFVPGIPQPQGSIRSFMHKGRLVTISDNPKVKGWRNEIGKIARLHIHDMPNPDEPIHLMVVFRLPKPKTAKRPHPTVRPDLDKLVRAVGDALTGIAWGDDSQVTCITALKTYDYEVEPGVRITVTAGR